MPHSTTSGSYSRESSVSRSNSKSLSGLGDGDGETNSGLEKFPDLIDPPSMRNLAGRPFSPGGLNGYGVGLNSGARLNGDRWMPAAARNVRWGLVYHVVHVFCLDQYFVQVHPEYLQKARHADYDTILSGRILLPNVLLAGQRVSQTTYLDTGSETPHTIPLEGCDKLYPTFGGFPSLSPLFTVFAYRYFFDIRYPKATYYSLIPLTLGVTLACSSNHTFKGEIVGILYALAATIIFVTQNIFSKRLFNEAAKAEAEGEEAKSRKLDKLNLLCYSSGLAFLLTSPIWLWGEGVGLIRDFIQDGSLDLSAKPNTFDHGRLTLEFLFNGTFHFGQNILAFVLLSLVSPVTYSVASLIKRVWVIVVAILWFGNPTTPIQAVGIALTFLGLYLYDRTSDSNKADRRAQLLNQSSAGNGPLLPLSTAPGTVAPAGEGPIYGSPISMYTGKMPYAYANGRASAPGAVEDFKKSDENGRTRQRGSSNAAWLAPGTKQEETWKRGDGIQAAS
ncbi:hypothetical protein CIB48_g8114 [Xylaria polymorpha]|nr:hypothetical protein CIB48_g8114 [Xylaria polymorpha]